MRRVVGREREREKVRDSNKGDKEIHREKKRRKTTKKRRGQRT